MSKNINFLDFTLNPQQRILSMGGERIEISSTAYKLLICFINNPGKIISRNELTERVWPNRVVTETSLDKLIQRLRKTLGDTEQHKEIIRTIHGVGFVFLPEVHVIEDTAVRKNTGIKKWTVPLLMVFILGLLTLLYWVQIINSDSNVTASNSEPLEKIQIVALIPNITPLANQDQAWMLTGGMHYLKEQFNQSQNLEIKNIGLKTIGSADPERYAIELSIENTIDAAVLVEVQEINEQFQATVKIRNSDGVIAEQSMQSESIKTLYDEIATWTHEILSIQSDLANNNAQSTMSSDRYAVENYIRGMSAQTSGYAAQAIKYFDLATREDPEFWLAWYELSLAHRKQGDYKKALSIISVFENVPLTDKNNLMIQNAKALNLYYLGEYAVGIEALNAGIVTARNSGNNKELSTFLTNKALFAKAMDDLDVAQSSIQESITIALTLKGNQDAKLGSAYNTLAGIEMNLNKLDSAQNNAQAAINYFKKSGKKRYEATAKSRLSSIHYALGDWNQGEGLIKEVLAIQQELEDTLGQTTSYIRLIDYSLMRGDFTTAQTQLDILSELMSPLSNKYQNDSFLITQIKLKTTIGDYQFAQNLLADLKAGITSDNRLFSYYLLSLKLFEVKKDQASWQNLANEFVNAQAFSDQPYSYLTKAQIAEKQNNLAATQDAFEQAKQTAIEQQDVMTVADVMNPYILFLLNNNPEAAYPNLLELEKYPVPAYPFLKIKAQVLVKQGEYFKAMALMEELKSIAGGHWTVDDQLLLEKYRKDIIENEG